MKPRSGFYPEPPFTLNIAPRPRLHDNNFTTPSLETLACGNNAARRIVNRIMSANVCTNCGAELVRGARFCRRCGQPSLDFGGGSITEAETKVFEADRGAQTQYYDQRPTGPSYMSPVDMSPPPQTATTTTLAKPKKRSSAPILILALVLIGFISFAIFAAMKWGPGASRTPTVTVPPVPDAPAIPAVPKIPQPPAPPQPPGTAPANDTALIYPGATVNVEMTRGTGGRMRQLTTSDSFDQVVAWYTARMKTVDKIKSNDSEPSAVFRGDGTTVVISSEDGLKEIVLQEGFDQDQ